MAKPGRPSRAERARQLASVPEGAIVDEALPDDVVDPWERRVTETDASWLAFVELRDHDLPRPTLRRIAEMTGAAYDTVREWSSKHDWQSRVVAYDRHIDEERRIRSEIARRSMHDRYARMAMGASGILIDRLLNLRPDELSPRLTFEALRIVQTVEMLARGENPMEGARDDQGLPAPAAALAAETPELVPGVDNALVALLEAMEDAQLGPAAPRAGEDTHAA